LNKPAVAQTQTTVYTQTASMQTAGRRKTSQTGFTESVATKQRCCEQTHIRIGIIQAADIGTKPGQIINRVLSIHGTLIK